MNKKLLSLAFALLGLGMLTAQENLRPSVHIGLPTGNSSDFFGFNIGADVAYLYPISDQFAVGGKAGLELFSGKNIPNINLKNKGATLIPITAAAQFDFHDSFFVGADLGFALSLNKDYDGGLYFMPRLGMKYESFQGFLFYKSISSKVDSPTYFDNKFSSISSVGIGCAYAF